MLMLCFQTIAGIGGLGSCIQRLGYIVVPDRGRWVRFSRTCESVELYADTEIDIGDTILVKAQVRPCKRNLLMLNTCVGFAKQVIGVNNPLILTPYQLYKHLEKIK